MRKKIADNKGALISIVIPVYNIEEYLERCLESVIEQTYRNLEIILIDDGSTDSSGEICEKYALKDKRIRVIHKQNGGLSDARNIGIDGASGEYITFIDSDDYVSNLYIEKLYELSLTYDSEVVCVNKINFEGRQCQEDRSKAKKEIKIFDGIQAIENMWYQKQINNSAWGKLYRKELFENIRYPVGKWYEDLATTYRLLFQAKKVIWSSDRLYFYYQRDNSIMNCAFDVRKLHRIEISEELLGWARNNCTELVDAAIARFFISNIQVLREIPVEEKYQAELQQISKNIQMYRKTVIINKNVKIINRIIAFCSMTDARLLKRLGTLYKRVFR